MDERRVAAPGRGRDAGAADRRQARRRSRDALSLLAATVIALSAPGVTAAAVHKHAPAKHAPAAKKSGDGGHKGHGDAKRHDGRRSTAARRRDHNDSHIPVPVPRPANPDSAPALALPPDLAATKHAIDLIQQHKFSEAAAVAKTIGDPLGQKLVEWAMLRYSDGEASLARYTAFIQANPDWPGIRHLRRAVEVKLWQEREGRSLASLRLHLAGDPANSPGRLAVAYAEMQAGNRASAEARVRAVWRSAELSAEMEEAVLAAFPGVLTHADHVARMDRRIGARDFGAAMRAARHAGGDHVAIVKACTDASAKPGKAGALLDRVPSGMRSDLGYALCRLHWLLRNDVPGANVNGQIATSKGDIAAAVKLVLAASPEDLGRQDTDEWWRVRRILARKLLDLGDPQTAYRVASGAAMPANPYYRADFHFTSGWIALRFLNDPATARTHFAHVDDGSTDPIVLSRAAYWRGRAAEAAGLVRDMRAQYERAASFPTAYYGQLARARMGLTDLAVLRPPPEQPPDAAGELVNAADLLYRIDERGLVRSFVADLAEESRSAAKLAALGQLTAQYDDAQSMVLIGRTALARGMILDKYAFPAIGVPAQGADGGRLDRCIVYSIVRTESSFDPHDKSSANAVGLMQVTPEAGRDTAKRFGMTYDWNRLVADSAYNIQMGEAEVAALLRDYHGSYILTFAGYNAGRGRVAQWLALHGDPRDPNVDAVDWVERIPFSETRNYVQRVMENLQVYRARFGATTATVEPNLHRAATLN